MISAMSRLFKSESAQLVPMRTGALGRMGESLADFRKQELSLRLSMARTRVLDRPRTTRPWHNVPNTITFVGYVAQLLWVAGAPWPFALVGLIADEADGRVARLVGETSEFGGLFDWATDMTLTGLIAAKAGLAWTLPVTTLLQVAMRERGVSPTVGSARAIYTIVALGRGGM